jgi:hypothetical protein
MDDREEAWGRLHEALPARWTVARGSYNPGERRWSMSAVGPDRGRGRLPTFVSGYGETELDAIRDLDARLRGEHSDGPRKLEELRARLRLAYVQGAEEWSRQEAGRPLSDSELDGVLARFSGVGWRPQEREARMATTLHEELAEILRGQGNRWMTTTELAQAVNERGIYEKADGSAVTDFQVHGRTKNYDRLFERDGSRVRLIDHG